MREDELFESQLHMFPRLNTHYNNSGENGAACNKRNSKSKGENCAENDISPRIQ